MLLRRTLLWPFSLLYGLLLRIRHALYDLKILRSTRPTVPTIAIGNLALGGTGKTPMLELVLRTLHGIGPIATLSRGYGRTSTSIHEVEASDGAERSGDEPLQVKQKFPEARVFVGADRVKAINVIQQEVPGVKAVVLDDALQHRKLNAGLNILLTTFQRPYHDDALLPAGNLRDLTSRAKAAQIVVVTKCPTLPSADEQQWWRVRLGLKEGQQLFFSGIGYDEFVVRGSQTEGDNGRRTSNYEPRTTNLLLLTGIADPAPLLAHLRGEFAHVEHKAFPDHHRFTPADLQGLAERFHKFAAGPKALITTEKDAARLRPVLKGSPLEGLPIAVIAMRTMILNEPDRFAELIHRHVGTHTAHR